MLDAFTGEETVSYPVPSSVQNGLADVLLLDYAAEPSVLWVEKSAIKRLSLLNRKVTSLPGKNYGKLVDVGLGEHGMFVALHADESAVVFRADGKDGKEPDLVYTFADSVCMLPFTLHSRSAFLISLSRPRRISNLLPSTLEESIRMASRTFLASSMRLLLR